MFVRHCHCHSEQYNDKNYVITSTVSLSERLFSESSNITQTFKEVHTFLPLTLL